jgi:hypothetical protein
VVLYIMLAGGRTVIFGMGIFGVIAIQVSLTIGVLGRLEVATDGSINREIACLKIIVIQMVIFIHAMLTPQLATVMFFIMIVMKYEKTSFNYTIF